MGNTYLDLAVEFVFTGATFLLGYMVSQGQLIIPTSAALIGAVLTGFVGAANHYRALRKAPVPPIGG